ncbi:GNAT family N-acetyltransferase [Periweissella ghanensis]|uniref:N-acetyltransferase domain-containing protein n=1 Tax=Periweissella ghanensis TaxID=467997 RepID=A0ABM8ZET2_9LACO|nr:GNAT family N-acetyltransferase [Periweissella ghanensis]MCM0600308.1 GNAT family N-acetyltransferase [Periweissella ghanensis]CAH0419220.1 hypothetical protein WGH24286_01667 [Periweissella ghanensis]
MHIKTDSFTIRAFTENEIPAFTEYHNNLSWMKYQGFKGLSASTFAQELLQPIDLYTGHQFAVVSNDDTTLFGDIYLQRDHDKFWLGYTINPEFARQGYMHKIIQAVISEIHLDPTVKAIMAGVEIANAASINLLKKLGFEYLETEDGEAVYVFEY